MSTCTRLSERTVRHTLQILEKVGLIVKVSQGRARIPGFYRLQNEAEWIDPSLLPEIRKNCSY